MNDRLNAVQSMLRRSLTFSSSNSKYPHFHKSVLSGWRGRPYANNAAAAAASNDAEAEEDASNPTGSRVKGRRIPKAERKMMLESFVNKYRATNAGAFPTVSYAREQLGGSHYVVKSILQELKYTAKMSPSHPAIEVKSAREMPADTSAKNGSVATCDTDLPEQEEVTEKESLTQVEENSTSEVSSVLNDSGARFDANLPGQEEVRETEYLTQVEENLTSETSADSSVQNDFEAKYDIDLNGATGRHLEAKEESHTSSVEIFSEEVITPEIRSPLVSTQSNMLKGDAGESSYKPGNDKEERFEVVSHPSDKSESSETVEAQADKHDFVAKEKDLPVGETNRAALPTFGDSEDMKKPQHALEDLPDFDDSKCKKEKYEEIPQPDKLPKDISGRQADDAEPSKKSTIWGNMKSLANGIINIFRKM